LIAIHLKINFSKTTRPNKSKLGQRSLDVPLKILSDSLAFHQRWLLVLKTRGVTISLSHDTIHITILGS
jgi:hypothetical protein